jgi:hypothetical protein
MKSIITILPLFTFIIGIIWLSFCFLQLPEKGPIVFYFIIVLVLTAGFFAIGWAIDDAWQMRGKRDWTETTGVITISTCETSFVMDHNGPIKVERHTLYAPKISYRYEVDATTYNVTGISDFTTEFVRSKEKVDSILRLYPVGKRVSVYYSPHNPAIAVLNKTVSRQVNLPLIVGLLLLIFGLCFSWVLTVFALNGGRTLEIDDLFAIPEKMRPTINCLVKKVGRTAETHPALKSNILQVKKAMDQAKEKKKTRPIPPLISKSELNDEIDRINKDRRNSESQRCYFLMQAYWNAHYYNEALAFSEKIIQRASNDWEHAWFATKDYSLILAEANRVDDAEKVLRTFAEKWGNEMKKENISLEEELQRIRTRPCGLPPK